MKIMIVEDEPIIRDMIGESMRKWGYETIILDDFSQVLEIFLKENPHLVLMDINLPVYDGFYWCNKIRDISKVPIIFISSRNTPMDMVMSINMGGDDFIQKPFYEEVLITKIKALLRRTYSYTETVATIIEHDGIMLNLNNGDVFYGDKKAELTKNEFKILNILMQNKGSVVSREKIMRNLWEDESFVDDNTLTVNITRIRKKLAELGKENYIATMKGEGYIIR
ncbi:MAG: response regulator transcription factor [Anaerovoracaceae bacterium]|jgi:DNA-binding response OmpR family regulator|uniref:Stage 0 sporulation protein A homolog n=1 Tax=Aminicella lysinilytica TaxID=433323 RepID=A0A4R6Q791_9FIRM|nr:response regulator transcription factor [Aminicella lysinilytica]TDP57676.1 DNA-binding response OmpR family regulator [Aminicella lysinilytica]